MPEGSSVDLDDSALDKGVGANKLVVGSIVNLGRQNAVDE